MRIPSRLPRFLTLSAIALALGACGGGQPTPAPAPAEQQPVAAAPAPAAQTAPAPGAATTTGAAPLAKASFDVLGVTFSRISDEGFPELELSNLTDRDIETINGSFLARNAEGAQVWGTGLTVAVPGQVFLAAGAKRIATPFGLDRKPEMMEILRTNPESLTFSFLAREVGFKAP